MTKFLRGTINEQWEVVLPDFRKKFYETRPMWERGRMEHCAKTFQEGMTVYDIGAEHGCMSALYQQWVGSGNVIPVEPSLPYWPCIRQTFEADGFGPPKGWFAGFISDQTDIHPRMQQSTDPISKEPGWPAASFGDVVEDFGFRHLAQQTIDTAQITLDDLASHLNLFPDAIQVDVEGAEGAVLRGGLECFSQKDVLVYVSWHAPTALEWYGETIDNLDNTMKSVGYSREELPYNNEGERFMLWTKQ